MVYKPQTKKVKAEIEPEVEPLVTMNEEPKTELDFPDVTVTIEPEKNFKIKVDSLGFYTCKCGCIRFMVKKEKYICARCHATYDVVVV